MEHLFRLVLTRPAVAQDDSAPSLRLTQATAFQAALSQAQQQDRTRREAMKTVARQFMGTAQFVGDPGKLPIQGPLEALDAALDALETQLSVSNADLARAIEDAFGRTPADLRRDGTLTAPIAALRDSLVAIKLVPEQHRRPIEALTNQLRDLELIGKAADDTGFPGSGAALRRYRRRSVMLPSDAELRSSLSTVEQQKELEKKQKAEEKKKQAEAEAKLDLYKRLNLAVDELTKLDADHLQTTPQKESDGFMVPGKVRPVQVLVQDMGQRQEFAKLDMLRAQRDAERPGTASRTATAPSVPEARFQREALAAKPRLIPGSPAFRPLQLAAIGFRLKATAADALSAGTLELLEQRKLSITAQPLDDIVKALRAEILTLGKQLDAALGRPVQRTFKRMGNAMVMISTPLVSAWNAMVVADDFTLGGIFFPIDQRVPRSHGSVAPAGVADLLVVKQQLLRYEGAEVAHIENVLKGEAKSREHSRRRETEELSFRETEVTTSEERELESTTRFEMSQESSQTIKEDATLKAGLTLSGKYGPTVDFSATAENSVSRNKEEATKAASRFSQDVTERSATKVTERVLERSSLRVTNEVVEKNSHSLDNSTGAGHVSGVYQWVNKVYQAQMFNYGIRMMYDFMVPEPAVFLISALQTAHANAVELEKPMPFTRRPDQILESNFHSWVQQYGATDVQPPPDLYKTKALDHNASAEDENVEFTHSAQIAIEDGYKAVHGTIGCVRTIWEAEAVVDVILGSRSHRFDGGDWMWSAPLNGEVDSIPFAMVTDLVGDVAIAVKVKCQRTDRALVKWQMETHAKLTTAYKARLSEYEEKLAALEVQAGVTIRGRNPMLNMELMKDELKKHCISILTAQHFDLFDAVQTGGSGVPQIDLFENEGEGPYVRFFEQAFEWEQMTWLTYPYFWGRKSQWRERIAYEDVDPIFNQFLKAGYCRVVVPVRPGFEGALDHFTTYGEVWNGGPLPAISNPLYLPIADEIAERLDRPGEEIAQGDPWLVRIPTTLVRLRPDDKLPAWTQDADGNWVEA